MEKKCKWLRKLRQKELNGALKTCKKHPQTFTVKVAECFVCACWVVGGVPSFCLSILLHNRIKLF